ncbi:hypothetical protein ACFQQB_19975 [Nonomuraea rubra]|uniref:hypothetical protein n=1 Tax=Nonomuraea rubra TaxID=46180 RepID=UPI003613A6FB
MKLPLLRGARTSTAAAGGFEAGSRTSRPPSQDFTSSGFGGYVTPVKWRSSGSTSVWASRQ